MKAEDIVELYSLLQQHGVRLWIDGGWGIDALLAEQTRPHKDLDALAHFDDLATMSSVLAGCGFSLKEIWAENLWVCCAVDIELIGRHTSTGIEVATAFVLRNQNGLEVDVHALTFDAHGYGIPAWNTDAIYPPDAFEGRGVILGTPVRCLSAQMQMATHTGYELKDKDLQDLRFLHERFGIAYLEEQARLMR